MRPYLRVANVYEDRIDLDDVMEMHFEAREVERYELKPGDILLNEGQSRELVGRPAMYRGELPGACFTNSLLRFQASEVVEGRFALALFLHWLKSGAFQSIGQITTNIAHLGAGRFGDMDFPVPPLNEQRRIVAKLEALQSRSRRAREALDAVPPLLEKLRPSILAAAFRGDLTKDWRAKHKDVEPASELLKRIRSERRKKWEYAELAKMKAKGKAPTDERWKAKYKEPEPVDATALPELPDGWCWAAFDELAYDSLYGPRFGAEQYSEDGFPMLRTTDLDDEGNVVWNAPPKVVVSKEDLVVVGLRPHDLVVTRTGATIGKCALYRTGDEPALPSAYLIRFGLIMTAVSPEYILQAFLSPSIQTRLRDGSTATAQPNVNARTIGRLSFPVAPAAEQTRILEVLSMVLARFGGVRTVRDAAAAALTNLERAALAKAFRGGLIPQDANDEPADVMLRRLATQSGEAPPNPKRTPKRKAS
jgi:type I restriction enzyme S subunit